MGFIIVGVILVTIGISLIFVQRHQNNRAFCIRTARAAKLGNLRQMAEEIAQEVGPGSWREYVKVVGHVVCDRPLTAPLSQQPCVHYQMSVKREYEETVTRQDSSGKSRKETRRSSETMSSDEQSVPFHLKDETGDVEVNLNGCDIETNSVVNDFRPEPAGGMISFGSFSMAIGRPNHQRQTLGYRYSESIVPLDRQLTLVATLADQGNKIILRKPDDNEKHFILSFKTAEELTKEALQQAKTLRVVMFIFMGLGVLLILIGLFQ